MDHCPYAYTKHNVGEYFFECRHYLVFGKNEPFALRRIGRIDLNAAHILDKIFNILFHVQMLDEHASGNRNHEAEHHIGDRNFVSKNTHQQHKAAEIHHRWRDEKGESNAKWKPCARKPHEKRNGRTGTERRDGA